MYDVSVSYDYLTNSINKVACKLKKSQLNRVSKSDTATKKKLAQHLKKAFNVTLMCECLVRGTLTSNLVRYRQQTMAMNTVSQQGTQRKD